VANKRKSTGNGNLKPRWKKGDPSPNPRGRPKKGASWAELVGKLGDMTPEEVKQWVASIGRRLPNRSDVTLRELAVLAAYVDCILDPNPRMLVALMERTEGKPLQAVEVGGSDKPLRIRVEYVDGEEAQALLRAGEGQG